MSNRPPNYELWYKGSFIPESEQVNARLQFGNFLAPNERKVLTSQEAALFEKPLEIIPNGIAKLSAWVGKTSGGPQRPDVVVAGVCQGKTKEEKKQWLKWGPTIETISGLDAAASVAQHCGCELHLWIVSQEYANLADQNADDLDIELDIGGKCEELLAVRYPGASIFNTQNREHRGRVYAAASETIFSRIYPGGIRKPYGIDSPSFWDHLDFSSCLGSMVIPALEKRHVWAVVDHDQLRPVYGAVTAFPDEIAGIFYWPAPNLAWTTPRKKTGAEYFAWLRQCPRRMHRHSDHTKKLHLLEPNDSITDKARNSSFSARTFSEILSYLQKSPASPGATLDLSEGMETFRQQKYPIPV